MNSGTVGVLPGYLWFLRNHADLICMRISRQGLAYMAVSATLAQIELMGPCKKKNAAMEMHTVKSRRI